MNLLELFSGTHSIGKVAKEKNYNVISLDRDLPAKSKIYNYTSENHIKEDIMNWDYKIYPPNYFYIITASPVCLWWSNLRNCWIGRKCKSINPTEIITKEILEEEIKLKGEPMVDKVIEIIKYFKPKYWWIENPQTGKMKHYIKNMYPEFNIFYDVDYCQYSDWGYQKKTRFWTNIKNFNPKICNKDCDNLIKRGNQKVHKNNLAGNNWIIDNNKHINVKNKELRIKYKEKLKHKKDVSVSVGSGTNRLDRYRIPEKLIIELFNKVKY